MTLSLEIKILANRHLQIQYWSVEGCWFQGNYLSVCSLTVADGTSLASVKLYKLVKLSTVSVNTMTTVTKWMQILSFHSAPTNLSRFELWPPIVGHCSDGSLIWWKSEINHSIKREVLCYWLSWFDELSWKSITQGPARSVLWYFQLTVQ